MFVSRCVNYGGRDGHCPWYTVTLTPTCVSRRVNFYPDVHFPTCEPLSRRAFRARHMKLDMRFPDVRFPLRTFHIGLVRGMVQVLDVRLSPEAYSGLQMSVQ